MENDITSLRNGYLQEDDAWDVLDGYESSFMISNHTTKGSFSSQSLLPSEPREGATPMKQHSAPVNVPEWSLVQTKNAYDDDENESPEEYFMRRSRSSSSSSVMEGVGRKLKGRDLSKIRNAILKKTGFLE